MLDMHMNAVAEQATFPLQTEALRSTMAFCQYLQYYELSPLDVALTARVRYTSVWNIAHGLPVKSAHATQVRWGLQHLTGAPYTASIVLIP